MVNLEQRTINAVLIFQKLAFLDRMKTKFVNSYDCNQPW